MIEEAAAFAEKAHRGSFRKGTTIPYIVHPLETAVIVACFTNDEEVIAAALLHDVVEDTEVTAQEVEEAFGPRVRSLVSEESEDKSKTWKERKTATLNHLKKASREVKLIALGDKLSNMRTTARDYMVIGDRVWERFNERRKECHAWYYWGVAQVLKEFQDSIYYQEYLLLCRQVFGMPKPGI